MIEVDTITLPAYFASAFVNGDYSGLTDAETKRADELVGKLTDDGWAIVDVARDADGNGCEPRFTWSYRLYGGDAEGGDVLDYVVHRIPSEAEETEKAEANAGRYRWRDR